MAQAAVNKVDQKLINGEKFDERLSTLEKSASTCCLGSDFDSRRALRCSWNLDSLNRPKLAAACEAWLQVLKTAWPQEDSVERDNILSAAVKAANAYEAIAAVLVPEFNRIGADSGDFGVEDGFGWPSLMATNQPGKKVIKKRPAAVLEEEGEEEDPDYEEEEDEDEEEEDEEGEEEEEEEDEVDEEEEVSASLPVIQEKTKATPPSKTTPPAKRGRKTNAGKEYIVPKEKLVILNNQISKPERYAIFDLSARKKVHFGADMGLGSLLDWTNMGGGRQIQIEIQIEIQTNTKANTNTF